MTGTHRRSMLCLLAVILASLAMLPGGSGAQEATAPAADEPPSFLLEPVDQDGPYFAITQAPGTTQELSVTLGNSGTSPVSALTYVADAYTLVNGGFGVETAEDEASEPTTWIDYQTETLDFAPGESVERAFTVSVPEGTAPGQYIAGLAIQTADSIAVGETDMLRQIIKKSVAVFITVPGPETPALDIGDVSINQTGVSSSLVVEVENTGNVFLNPTGSVTLTTEAGEQVTSGPVTMGPVYAGDATTLDLSIPVALPTGTYTASVSLADEATGASAEVSDVPVQVTGSAVATPAAAPVTVASSLEAIEDESGALQAVNVTVELTNEAAAIPGARLTLHVSRDGEPVEDYPLNASLALPTGTTEVQQRYIPLDGWEPGTYTFALTLEAIDPATGQATVLATQDIEETVTAP